MNVYMERALNIKPPQAMTASKMDAEYFESIYHLHYKSVYNYIGFRINNHFDAEELASAVFENAIRKFHLYKHDHSPIEAWLIGIAKNVVADYLRRKRRMSFIPLDGVFGFAADGRRPDDVLVFNEANKVLIQTMARLKPQERQVLSMKFATGLKNTEIAKILNLSDSKVGVTIHRSVKKLRKWLEEGNTYEQ